MPPRMFFLASDLFYDLGCFFYASQTSDLYLGLDEVPGIYIYAYIYVNHPMF